MFRTNRILGAVLVGTAALLAACDSPTGADGDNGKNPPPLSMALTTDDDADRILLTTLADPAVASLNVCLVHTTESGWWKGIGINSVEPTLQGEKSEGSRCTPVGAGVLRLTFWKAKAFGAHTQVGARTVDLTLYAGHRIYITWQRD